MTRVLALDVGTSSVRAQLFDEDAQESEPIIPTAARRPRALPHRPNARNDVRKRFVTAARIHFGIENPRTRE